MSQDNPIRIDDWATRMMPIQFTVHTVNYDQLIWMILEETIVDERSEINRLAEQVSQGLC